MDIENSTIKGYKIDTEEDVKLVSEHFMAENKEIFLMLGQRLEEYSSVGNFLFINWLSQAVINMLQDANNKCEEKILNIDKTKVQ